jgi:hypothetical protein
MKNLTLLILILSFSQSAFSSSDDEGLKLSDISFSFDQTKVDASIDSFHFLRSFVGYFYGIIAKNSSVLNITTKTSRTAGWCVGDAHAENFGISIQENSSLIFSINDLDDAGPCPVAYDILRFMVSSKLYLPEISYENLLLAYKEGVQGNSMDAPSAIISLSNRAIKKGIAINPSKLEGGKLKRDSSASEVCLNLRNSIQSLIGLNILDIIATSKIGGGSGGLQRYEILVTDANHLMILLELKELVEPSIAVVKTSQIPAQEQRIKKALTITQGKTYSHYYNVVTVNGKSMLLRPKFAGNKGVDLSENNEKDNEEIMLFEAYVLGRIHASSVNATSYLADLEQMKKSDWEADSDSLVHLFKKKYKSLRK